MSALRPTGRALLLAALCAIATAAHAGDVSLQGDRLALTTTGDVAANIQTDSGTSAGVRIIGDDLSCLKAHGGGETIEINTEGCGSDLGNLTIMVPPGFPVALVVQGDGDVHIGDVGSLSATLNSDGGLTVGHSRDIMLSLHGDGDATVGSVDGAADVRITGSGDVKLGHVQGVLHASLNGSGDLTVSGISSPAADIAATGSGDVSIGGGNISAVRASTNGSGDVTIAAVVDAADLQASGGGDMKLSNVTGVVKRNASGGSSIHIGGNAMDMDSLRHLKIPPIPPIPPIPAIPGVPTINLSSDDWPNHSANDSSHIFGHVLAGIGVLVVIYFIWRTVQRRGGIGNFATPSGNATTASHPGVLAIRDTLTRLDGRLAQVETYVTSREFDLQRKFRDLDKH